MSEVIESNEAMEEVTPRKVLIATPAYDGRLDVWFTNSLINAIRVAQASGIFLHPVFMSYDALIQRARNDLIRLAVEEEYDDLIWIDSDLEFNPLWIMELLANEKDVIGVPCPKKTDREELYNVRTKNLEADEDGLIEIESIGTGFLKLSRKAVLDLWENSVPYQNEGRECRMVCEVLVEDGELVSEDNVMCRKLRDLGYAIWVAPTMTCAHTGVKKYYGDFGDFVQRIKKATAA